MDMMEGLLREPDGPLSIVVTDAGSEILRLRSLAKEAIPMLLRPETHSLSQRLRIAEGFKEILEGDGSGDDRGIEFAEGEDKNEDGIGYEPGEVLDWLEKEWD